MTPYLSFSGNCAEALEFYQSVFGGVLNVHHYAGSPMEADVPPEFKHKIMHATLTTPSGTIMASDTSHPLGQGVRVSLSISASDADAGRIFESLSAGGHVMMPLGDVFWGGKFGMLTDKFGFSWMLSVN